MLDHNMPAATNSAVRDFYAGKCVALTGVTGFVGKVLLESLLRSSPELKTVYVIVRGKKGTDASERITDMLRTKYAIDFDENAKTGVWQSAALSQPGMFLNCMCIGTDRGKT